MYSSPDDIAVLYLTKLSDILSKDFQRALRKTCRKFLKSLAKSSVGVKTTYISIQITQTIALIELIEIQLTDTTNKLSRMIFNLL